MPQNIKKSKDDKNQMQRRLSNEITKSIKLCDFLLILLSGGELGSPPQELEFQGPVGPGNSSTIYYERKGKLRTQIHQHIFLITAYRTSFIQVHINIINYKLSNENQQ